MSRFHAFGLGQCLVILGDVTAIVISIVRAFKRKLAPHEPSCEIVATVALDFYR